MGWLLHSKKFKEKLAKWIIMYIAVMCLLGSVITYSKYISSLVNKDPSQVGTANFNLTIEPVFQGCEEKDITIKDENGNETTTKVENCSLTTRPTKGIEYLFTVDYDELDVNTEIILRMAFNSVSLLNYKNIILSEVELDAEGKEFKETPLFKFDDYENNSDRITIGDYGVKRGNNSILLTDVLRIKDVYNFDGEGNIVGDRIHREKTFKIKMEINENNVANRNDSSTSVTIPQGEYVYNKEFKDEQFITIGFTATQFRDDSELSRD